MSGNLINRSSKPTYTWASVLVCYKGVCVCVCINSSSWIVYVTSSLFIYYHHALPKLLSPHKGLLSCSSIHFLLLSYNRLRLLHLLPLPFSLPFSSPGMKYPLLLQLLQLISLLSPPVLSGGVKFPPATTRFRGNPSSLVCTSSFLFIPQGTRKISLTWETEMRSWFL